MVGSFCRLEIMKRLQVVDVQFPPVGLFEFSAIPAKPALPFSDEFSQLIPSGTAFSQAVDLADASFPCRVKRTGECLAYFVFPVLILPVKSTGAILATQ